MDQRIEKLCAMGCDTAEAMERMADDEEFYIECLQEALENPGFEGIQKALAANDVDTAFDCAHALKGVLGNVGLTPMFCETVEIVEPLRIKSRDGVEGHLAKLLEMQKLFAQIVS